GAKMEIATMGRVTTEAMVENLQDLWDVNRSMLAADQIRKVTISDALVDTGATTLSLPSRLIKDLGLRKTSSKQVTTSSGEIVEAALYDAVRLTIQDRNCTIDVLEVPDNLPALIGQIPLELLDFVVDLRGRKLIGNPAHGGEHMFELY
ncbi:MAG TPA: aspartyl protease family protein, partial [Gemmataceae bacterium]|nr:aspartyl protease family protein [Gemmataceae bacterium]